MKTEIENGTGKKWLVVDDDSELVVLTAVHLKLITTEEVVKFTSPSAALDAIAENPGAFSHIVTDRNMPGMCGEELLVNVRTLNPAIRAIVMTGNDAGLAAALDQAALSAAILLKPFTTEQLVRAVEEAPGLGDRLEIMDLWGAGRAVGAKI